MIAIAPGVEPIHSKIYRRYPWDLLFLHQNITRDGLNGHLVHEKNLLYMCFSPTYAHLMDIRILYTEI